MRLGYPCVNLSVGCTSSSTFRLSSYSEVRLYESVGRNLACLDRILRFNVERGLLHFRVSSDLVPLASHPVCVHDWRTHFMDEFRAIGRYAESNGMRLSMHPGQYTLLNTPRSDVLTNSIRDLEYHDAVLSAMGLGRDAKIQIHVGGVYGDKGTAMRRFLEAFENLTPAVRSRLVIENDERFFTVSDCVVLSQSADVPVVVDSLHHRANDGGLSLSEAISLAVSTWKASDGPQMLDYSSQDPQRRAGSHAYTIDESDFRMFVEEVAEIDCDVMLEIKDKERSAMKALEILRSRSVRPQ